MSPPAAPERPRHLHSPTPPQPPTPTRPSTLLRRAATPTPTQTQPPTSPLHGVKWLSHNLQGVVGLSQWPKHVIPLPALRAPLPHHSTQHVVARPWWPPDSRCHKGLPPGNICRRLVERTDCQHIPRYISGHCSALQGPETIPFLAPRACRTCRRSELKDQVCHNATVIVIVVVMVTKH